MASSREAKVDREFYRLTKNVLEKNNYVIEGLKFGEPEPQYRVDSGWADLMVPTHTPKPLLITEFKRKIKTPGGWKAVENIDPLGSKVITQALTYAVQCGAPFFATTNGRMLALFTMPERGEPFRMDRHRLLVKEIQLNEDSVEEVLRVVAKWYSGIKVERTPLDWTFIMRLRSFVEWLSGQMLKATEKKLKADGQFNKRYEEFVKEIGGIAPEAYAREAAYILMNKIVFYKILERYYGKLPILKPIPPKNGVEFSVRLKGFFEKAMEITEDFEPIFAAGFYDEAPLSNDPYALDEINAFIDDMGTYRLEEVGSDVVGFIYERLIPDEERHRLGQFYTPPQIAELIVKWAVREPTDKVMDPGCGSGTFLVKAYGRLRQLRPLASESIHRELLTQLYGIDINSFPAHITAVNLAMRDVTHPTSEMNIVVSDFFHIMPNQKVFAPYTIKTPKGEMRREILIPLVDAVVANPPYTRWTEIPEKTQEAIKKRVAETLKRYNLTARVRQGIEPGIYLHFIIWAHEFLKPGGRLGMIISDSWLQTDYGIDFGRFLLDHFKVKAVIDISARVFPIPLIGTCIILLEKEVNKELRENNQTVFMYLDVPKDATFPVEDILKLVEKPEPKEGQRIAVIKQESLFEKKKWINYLFNVDNILLTLDKRTVKIGEFFDTSHGNFEYLILASKGKINAPRNIGANPFFYLTKTQVEQWGLEEFAKPALTSSRYANNFVFTEDDWKQLRDEDKPCYVFTCHKPKSALPQNVREYIKYGETKCKIRGDKVASQALSCQAREAAKEFCGWYDLGQIKEVAIFTPYYTQYRHRFNLARFPFALDADFIGFLPKKSLSELQLKVLLAFLNSSFAQLWLELSGRSTGGGMLSIEASQAQEIPIIDVRRLNEHQIKCLATLFDELESEARRLGGAHKKEGIYQLWDSTIAKIDGKIAEILGLSGDATKEARLLAKTMMERRLARAEEARPEAIRGEELPRIKIPKKMSRSAPKVDRATQPLERWIR